ncbi:MAG TPA: DUF3857 domain-containing protein [Candidatus Solibacter sp.]|nr:DUF3857 domain-containing protein [Candidatus Solibacter sp.]
MFRSAALLGLIFAAAACAADDTPGWLKELTSVTLPAYPAKVNSVVMFNEQHTTAAESGKLTTVTRTAIKVITQQGGNIRFFDDYETRSGKVRDFRAWMIAPSGKVKKYGKDEIVDVACVDNDVYNECRRRVVSGKRDAELGAIFGYESTIEYESFDDQVFFNFQDSSPVRLARLEITVPPSWEVKSVSFNGAPKEAVSSAGTYTWQMENLAAIEREPASPGFLSIVPWVGVNLMPPGGKRTTTAWPAAAKLLADLHSDTAEPSDAITAKARSLVEGASTEFEKIRAIGKFTQQVNYLSIQVNIAKGGGYRPHSAAQTFQKLYGDCKDKANLTRAMLKAVGITAYPVAIYSGDRTHVQPEWPSLGAFNHAITAIRVGPDVKSPAVLDHPKLGRLLFFDPTDSYVAPGYLPDHEQASLALIGAPENGGLVRVPAGAAVAAERERKVDAVLTAEGAISGKFVEKRTGEALADAVAAYRGQPRADYLKRIERWIGISIPSSTSSGIDAQEANGEFTLKGEFQSTRFAQRPQQKMMIFRAGLLRHGEYRLTEKTRKYPIVLDTDALSETVRIELPKEFKVDELPAPIKVDSPFGKIDAGWKVEAGYLVFHRTLEMSAQTVPAEQYGALRKFLDAVSAAEDAPVVLIR